METSLPDDKLRGLISNLQSWSSCKKCCKRDLLSLIGKLNSACHIIPACRIFLHCLINLSTTAHLPHHHITMNREACRDIAWWLKFLPSLNGRAVIPDPYWTRSPDLEKLTDTSRPGSPLYVSSLPTLPTRSASRLLSCTWRVFVLLTL